ncbi:MAG: NUDIX hydrolase [Candidatus Nanosalina sp.]
MGHDKFKVVVKGWITHRGKILIGQKEEDPEHPIGGEWHFLGGHVEKGEQMEEAVKREVREETGLEGEVHQIVDVMTFDHSEESDKDAVQTLYHFEADSSDAEALDDLQDVKWVKPEELIEELGEEEAERIENRERQENFLEKLKKAPAI